MRKCRMIFLAFLLCFFSHHSSLPNSTPYIKSQAHWIIEEFVFLVFVCIPEPEGSLTPVEAVTAKRRAKVVSKGSYKS